MELGAAAQECCCLLCESGAEWELRVSAVPLYNMRYDVSVTFPLGVTVCHCYFGSHGVQSGQKLLRVSARRDLSFFFWVTMSQEHKMNEKKNGKKPNSSMREKTAEEDVRVLLSGKAPKAAHV